ncbi:hydantoinase B/oxoprolinase family protein [Pseudonocardia sp. MCCB 268]|nr:hydantoinase B/oxoprolinase family protein [Pseudonocardia cytotoxica]
MVSDPYRMATTSSDICFIRPVFHDGEIVTFVALRAHQLDMGGVVPAGFSAVKKDVYGTGSSSRRCSSTGTTSPSSTSTTIFDNARYAALLNSGHDRSTRTCCSASG